MTVGTAVRCRCCRRIAVVMLDQPIESQSCPFCGQRFEKAVAEEIVRFHGPHIGPCGQEAPKTKSPDE